MRLPVLAALAALAGALPTGYHRKPSAALEKKLEQQDAKLERALAKIEELKAEIDAERKMEVEMTNLREFDSQAQAQQTAPAGTEWSSDPRIHLLVERVSFNERVFNERADSFAETLDSFAAHLRVHDESLRRIGESVDALEGR